MRALGIALVVTLLAVSMAYGRQSCAREKLEKAVVDAAQIVREAKTTSKETSNSASTAIGSIRSSNLTQSGRVCVVAALAAKRDDFNSLLVAGPEPFRGELISLSIIALDQDTPLVDTDLDLFDLLVSDAGTWPDPEQIAALSRTLKFRLLRSAPRDLNTSRDYRERVLAMNTAFFLERIGKRRGGGELLSTMERGSEPLLAKLLQLQVRLTFADPKEVTTLLRRADDVVRSEKLVPAQTEPFELALETETFLESFAATAHMIGSPDARPWLKAAPFLVVDREALLILHRVRALSLRSFAFCWTGEIGNNVSVARARGTSTRERIVESAELWVDSVEDERAGDTEAARRKIRVAAMELQQITKQFGSSDALSTDLKPYDDLLNLYHALVDEAAISARWLQMAVQAGDKEDAGEAAAAMLDLAQGLHRTNGDEGPRLSRIGQAAALAAETFLSVGWYKEAAAVSSLADTKIHREGRQFVRNLPLLHSELDLALQVRNYNDAAAILDMLRYDQIQTEFIYRVNYPTEAGTEPPEVGLWPANQPSISFSTPGVRLEHLLDVAARLQASAKSARSVEEEAIASIRIQLSDIILTETNRYLTRSSRGTLIYSYSSARSAGITQAKSLARITEELLRYRSLSDSLGKASGWSLNQFIDDYLENAFSAIPTVAPMLPLCLLPGANTIPVLRADYRDRLEMIDADRRAMASESALIQVAKSMDGDKSEENFGTAPLEFSRMKAAIRQGETLVQAIVLRHKVWLIAISHNSNGVVVANAGPLDSIEGAITSVQRSSRNPELTFDAANSFRLFETFIKPFIQLPANSRPIVFLILDEQLSGLPINSLVTNRAARVDDLAWIDLVVDVRLEASLQGWLDLHGLEGPIPRKLTGGLILGGPNLGPHHNSGTSLSHPRHLDDLGSIPNAEDIMFHLSRGWGLPWPDASVQSDAFTRSAVLEGELKQRLEKASRIALVTHGLSSTDAQKLTGRLEPALVVTPEDNIAESGVIYGSDIAALNLSAEIVILLACNSAQRSDARLPEEFRGMADAFLLAGAHSVLAANWSIDPNTTDVLITSFAANAERENPRQALRTAMQTVRARGFSHPYFWAAFSYIGL